MSLKTLIPQMKTTVYLYELYASIYSRYLIMFLMDLNIIVSIEKIRAMWCTSVKKCQLCRSDRRLSTIPCLRFTCSNGVCRQSSVVRPNVISRRPRGFIHTHTLIFSIKHSHTHTLSLSLYDTHIHTRT